MYLQLNFVEAQENKALQKTINPCGNEISCRKKIENGVSNDGWGYHNWFIEKDYEVYGIRERLSDIKAITKECECYIKNMKMTEAIEQVDAKLKEFDDAIAKEKQDQEKYETNQLAKEKQNEKLAKEAAEKKIKFEKLGNTPACKKIVAFYDYCGNLAEKQKYVDALEYQKKLNQRSGTTAPAVIRSYTAAIMNNERGNKIALDRFNSNKGDAPPLSSCKIKNITEANAGYQYEISSETMSKINKAFELNCGTDPFHN